MSHEPWDADERGWIQRFPEPSKRITAPEQHPYRQGFVSENGA